MPSAPLIAASLEALGNGAGAGHVRVYEYANNTWTQLGADIDGELNYLIKYNCFYLFANLECL